MYVNHVSEITVQVFIGMVNIMPNFVLNNVKTVLFDGMFHYICTSAMCEMKVYTQSFDSFSFKYFICECG